MTTYSPAESQPLDYRGHVRLRPAMYFGGTDKQGLHRLLFRLLEYPVEDAILGACSHISITLKPEHEIAISSNSDTFPTEPVPNTNKRLVELLFTQQGVEKSFTEPGRYRFTRGFHGVFLYAINAACTSLKVTVAQDGYLWAQSYHEGLPLTPLEQVRSLAVDEPTGNMIKLQPDSTIFGKSQFDFDLICARCRELAYQVAGLMITVRDERGEPRLENTYHYPNGLTALVRDAASSHVPLHEPALAQQAITHPQYDDRPIGVEIAFEFNESNETHIFSFSKTIATLGGGTHVSAVQSAITSYINNCRLNLDHDEFSWDDVKLGLSFAVNVRHPFPSHESITEPRLINPDVYGIVSGIAYQLCHEFYAGKHTVLREVLNKCLANRANRLKDATNDDLFPP